MLDHVLYKCPPGCRKTFCNYCDGGLAFCTVCKGGESQLPQECPGRVMTECEMRLVSVGRLDFVGGKWIKKGESNV